MEINILADAEDVGIGLDVGSGSSGTSVSRFAIGAADVAAVASVGATVGEGIGIAVTKVPLSAVTKHSTASKGVHVPLQDCPVTHALPSDSLNNPVHPWSPGTMSDPNRFRVTSEDASFPNIGNETFEPIKHESDN